MPLRTISQFKTALGGGGVRPNLFEVRLDASNLTEFMGGVPAENLAFMCKAANLPAQNVASIDVPFRGRTFKVAGDRTIDNWSITVIQDEDFRLRNAFESWTQQIARLDNNLGATDPSAYMVNAKVFQLGRGSTPASTNSDGTANTVLKEYEFVDIFPITVSPIDLSYDSGDAIEEFTVEFAVQSVNLIAGGTPNG